MTSLFRAKVYRNVELPSQWLGLEPFDAILLGGIAWLLMTFNRGAAGWNVLVVVLAYAGLRAAKRGKPPGHTTAVLRFYLARKPFFSAAAADTDGAAHPFCPSPGPSPGHNPRARQRAQKDQRKE